MLIVHVSLILDLPYVHSIKGRRKILNAIKDRLKNRNIAIADLSGEYAREARLELLFFAPTPQQANNKIEKLHKLLEESFPELFFELSYEII